MNDEERRMMMLGMSVTKRLLDVDSWDGDVLYAEVVEDIVDDAIKLKLIEKWEGDEEEY